MNCSQAAPTYVIIGRLVVRDGALATFTVDAIEQSPSHGLQSTPAPPILRRGQRVTVDYFHRRSRFLRVGTRYRVDLYWDGVGNRFGSDVHVSGDACSGGTVYANGKAINTSGWVRSHLGLVVGVAVLVPLLVAVLLIFAVSRAAARRRARRNRSFPP